MAVVIPFSFVGPQISTTGGGLPNPFPGPTANSPAELLRASIIAGEFGTDPTDEEEWPVFVGHMPDEPDNAVCVYDTTGIMNGRIQSTGESIRHPGWQVRVRSSAHPTGYAKIASIRNHIDSIHREGIELSPYSYTIYAATLTGGVQALGQEAEVTRRDNFTINGILTYR